MHDETRPCPFCGEQILAVAFKCKHCQTMLDGSTPFPSGTPAPTGVPGSAGFAPASGPPSAPLAAGVVVGLYRIVRMLGQGGMGAVYLAEHTLTGQEVAIKVIWPELMREQNVVTRFLEEARVMGKLHHHNIVPLLNFFEEGGRYHLVMGFIDGRTLDSVLNERPLSVDESVRIMTALLSALDYAHSLPQPVIHRDIKPANIMLRKDGTPVLTDFGVAKALGRGSLTRAGGAVGTPEYMAPEQVQGEDIGPATDLYALGITFYKMLTGVVPFPQRTDGGYECMTAHVTKPLPPVAEFREGLPSWVQGVLERTLAKSPSARFSSASAMVASLSSPTATPPQPKPRKAPAERAAPAPKPRLQPASAARPGTTAPTPSPSAVTVHSTSSSSKKLFLLGAAALAMVVAVVLAVIFVPNREEEKPTPQTVWRTASTGVKEENARRAAAEKVPDSPEKVVTETARAIKEGDLLLVYAMLPDTYQADVQGLVKKIGANMDKEVYEKGFALLPKFVEAAKEAEQFKPFAPLAEGVVKLLTDAKLNTHDGLKALDAAAFLNANGKAIMDLVWTGAAMAGQKDARKMLEITAKLKGEAGEKEAIVEITVDGQTKEEKFVKVEGKWIPEGMSKDWKKGIEDAGKSIDGGLKGMTEKKVEIVAQIDAVAKMLDEGNVDQLMGMMGSMF